MFLGETKKDEGITIILVGLVLFLILGGFEEPNRVSELFLKESKLPVNRTYILDDELHLGYLENEGINTSNINTSQYIKKDGNIFYINKSRNLTSKALPDINYLVADVEYSYGFYKFKTTKEQLMNTIKADFPYPSQNLLLDRNILKCNGTNTQQTSNTIGTKHYLVLESENISYSFLAEIDYKIKGIIIAKDQYGVITDFSINPTEASMLINITCQILGNKYTQNLTYSKEIEGFEKNYMVHCDLSDPIRLNNGSFLTYTDYTFIQLDYSIPSVKQKSWIYKMLEGTYKVLNDIFKAFPERTLDEFVIRRTVNVGGPASGKFKETRIYAFGTMYNVTNYTHIKFKPRMVGSDHLYLLNGLRQADITGTISGNSANSCDSRNIFGVRATGTRLDYTEKTN
jgi:hypothetical protein